MIETKFGFRWGNIWVERTTHLPGKGRVVTVSVEDSDNSIQVYVSEGGRSIRAFKGEVEMLVPND